MADTWLHLIQGSQRRGCRPDLPHGPASEQRVTPKVSYTTS